MAASSALPMVFVMPVPFNDTTKFVKTKLGGEVAGLYVPAPFTCLP